MAPSTLEHPTARLIRLLQRNWRITLLIRYRCWNTVKFRKIAGWITSATLAAGCVLKTVQLQHSSTHLPSMQNVVIGRKTPHLGNSRHPHEFIYHGQSKQQKRCKRRNVKNRRLVWTEWTERFRISWTPLFTRWQHYLGLSKVRIGWTHLFTRWQLTLLYVCQSLGSAELLCSRDNNTASGLSKVRIGRNPLFTRWQHCFTSVKFHIVCCVSVRV